MNNRSITHEIKLEKSTKVILAIAALGICLHAFAPVLSTKQAMADIYGGESFSVFVSGSLGCDYGCSD